MILDFNFQSTLVKYRLLSNTITPRPIAWIVSLNKKGVINIAPFSFFGVVSCDPAVFSLCLTQKSDGSLKDTLSNAIETKKITITLPSIEFMDIVEKTSMELESDTSEAVFFNIPLELIDCKYPPIVKNIQIAYFCDFLDLLDFGQYNKTLLVKVQSCYIQDSLYTEDLQFIPHNLGRVGKFFLHSNNLIDRRNK